MLHQIQQIQQGRFMPEDLAEQSPRTTSRINATKHDMVGYIVVLTLAR